MPVRNSKTLTEVRTRCQNSREKAVKTGVGDHGYRSPKIVGDTQIIFAGFSAKMRQKAQALPAPGNH